MAGGGVRGRALAAAAVSVLVLLPATSGRAAGCTNMGRIHVPHAAHQDAYCLDDLTTHSTKITGHTNYSDWEGLQSNRTKNPTNVPGIQVDGYFPDSSQTNSDNGYSHDAQFVIRLPDDWNGGVVISGAPGIRGQYANDFIFSDWFVAQGYAFASTDKGNTGDTFYRDGNRPGDAVAEWNHRVTQLTKAVKAVATQRYGSRTRRTYIVGISNGGYLVRHALENHADLYDGGVDWEGTLFRAGGPNLFTYLPVALRQYPKYRATGSRQAARRMIRAGFAPNSKFLWNYHYSVYWDLTQRLYREEFDPTYDGALEAGVPFCQQGTPNCDANYHYDQRPDRVHRAVGRVSNSGNIGKPLITLHGTLDSLLPIRTDSDVYKRLVENQGRGALHRYYVIQAGNHVDGLYDTYPQRLRPILPCFRAAFKALRGWVQRGDPAPASQTVAKPDRGGGVNRCRIGNYRYRARPGWSTPASTGG